MPLSTEPGGTLPQQLQSEWRNTLMGLRYAPTRSQIVTVSPTPFSAR